SARSAQAAIRAARAGVDLLLFVGSERSTAAVYDALLAEARAGRLPRAGLEASAARIEDLAATSAGYPAAVPSPTDIARSTALYGRSAVRIARRGRKLGSEERLPLRRGGARAGDRLYRCA